MIHLGIGMNYNAKLYANKKVEEKPEPKDDKKPEPKDYEKPCIESWKALTAEAANDSGILGEA